MVFDGAVITVLASCVMLVFDQLVERFLGAPHPISLSFRGSISLWGAHLLVQSAMALTFTLLEGASNALVRLAKGRIPVKWAGGASFAAAAYLPFFFVGSALAKGDWISQQTWAAAIAPLLGLFGALFFLAAGIVRSLSNGVVRAAFAVGCGVLAVGILVANALIYPGIYPAFHALAYGVSSSLFFLSMERLTARLLPTDRKVLRDIIGVGGLALATAGLVFFCTMSQSTRAELLIKSRTAELLVPLTVQPDKPGRLDRVLKRIYKSQPIAFDTPRHPLRQLEIPSEWNIVLIVSDAMRADTLPPARGPDQAHAKPGDTPFLDQWIKGTYRFQYAYSPANITHVSMPSIFRGITPANLRAGDDSPALSVKMRVRGRATIAVVNRLFATDRKHNLKPLLRGFHEVSFYPDWRQKDAVATMMEAVDRVYGEPFFAWFHFYCLHNPYYAEGGIQKESEGLFPERYRRALRWLDHEVERLLLGLEARGLEDNTVFIFTADHGEGLGDHRLNTHGSYVFDEETRVPLYIKIPKRPGALITATVGLIDLGATLTDLAGHPAGSMDGVSLVPLIVNPKAKWGRDYYLENSSNNYVGVVKGRDKLVYARDADTLFRFDLTLDPKERENLYRAEGELDQLLLSRLIYHQPGLFAHELKKPEIRDLLSSLRRRADIAKESAAAELLERVRTRRSAPGTAIRKKRRMKSN
jgi:membrane-anchored protein YejM (alkaline phosphatase superfamily)